MSTEKNAQPAGIKAWRPVGTVVGNAGTSEYTFILKQYQAKVGDIVALGMQIPDNDYSDQNSIYVWARVVDIKRFNPFFPYEAAQEIAGEGLSLEDTVLSGTRDQLEATALILGATSPEDLSKLFPLTYPVKPACTVYNPPTDAVRTLLISDREREHPVSVGSLIARRDVEVTLSARRLVSRHMAILAMTGGGKTVASRRIIRELIRLGYPLFILDPHGDYIGLIKCQELLKQEAPDCEIKLFYPDLLVQQNGEDLITTLILQMTNGLTEPQSDYLRGLYDRKSAINGLSALGYIKDLLKQIELDFAADKAPKGLAGNWKPSVGAVRRSLNIVRDKLERMRLSSEQMRRSPKLKVLPFDPLPNPFNHPEAIIRPGQVSILYLGGYDHITQCSIAAITLERLFDLRANLGGEIPPFLAVIEEAHTFIPSVREGTQDAVSLPVIRRIITEGRKFGTGLMLISQRPSRLDETIISQCNSFLILRLVNPRDQNFVRAIMENLTESDARMLPGFGPGQGIVSGQVVKFPLPVHIKMDEELLATEIGDEDFFEQVEEWKPASNTKAKKKIASSIAKAEETRKKAVPAKKTAQPATGKRGRKKKA